ncbi:hypothetical protein DPM19_32650 [Actinomadura craniellae]|uniref:PH domain-containing protein n=1 Tax=Actinomadura craniellae TaxID=2231787 RepID=A0A365GW78_9ACTN|nr:hypothetical protein [Actinomadura craniellae]RAY11054.1 hypothetical protein DPM19_32650 [Actinomadura craniellae]
MNDVVFRPTSAQTAAWLVAAGIWVGGAVLHAVASAVLLDGATSMEDLGFSPDSLLFDLAVLAAFLLAFRADQRRGIAMDDAGVTVMGWAGTRRLAYEEISHAEVRRKLGTDQVLLHLTNGRKVLLAAPKHGRLMPDARFAEKLAVIEGQLGRHARPGGTTTVSAG